MRPCGRNASAREDFAGVIRYDNDESLQMEVYTLYIYKR